MTINSTTRTAGPFAGNGVTRVYPFSFKVFTRDDVLVARTNVATNVETVLTLDADYTVALNSDQNANPGGTITMVVAPAVGTTLAATSNIPYLQKTDLTNQGGFYPRVISDALDKVTIQIQQLAAKVGTGLNVGAAAAVATVLGFIDKLATNVGASLVGFLQAGVGAILRTIQDKLFEMPSVLDYGAKGDGVTDDSNAIIAALLANKNRRLWIPRRVYRLTKGLTIGGQNTSVIAELGAVFDFYIADQLTNCIRMAPDNYAPLYLEGLTLNCNYSGFNGISASQGAPKLKNIVINAPRQNAIEVTLSSATSDWVENMSLYNVLANGCGQHGLHIYMEGAWNGTPFCNETLIEQFEVRGIGKNTAQASAVRFTFNGTTVAPVSGFTMLQCNFDAQVAYAVAPVSHTVYGKSINGGIGALEALYIKGGGWESTGTAAPAGLKNFEVDANVRVLISNIVGIINSDWGYGVGAAYLAEKSNYYSDANGAYLPTLLPKADGYALKATGGLLGGFSNTPTGFHTRDNLIPSANKTVDIPIGLMPDYASQGPIVVMVTSKGYPDSLAFFARGIYIVWPSRTNVNLVQSEVWSAASAQPAYHFDPAAVSFSIPATGTLRVTIPGGANVGAGTSPAFDVSATRMLTPLPGLVTTLPL